MSEYVKASLMSDLLKSLPGLLDKTLDWLKDTDLDVKDQKEIKDEETGESIGYMYTARTGGGKVFQVKCLQSAGRDDLCDVYLLGKDGKKGKKAHLKDKEVEDFVTDWVENTYGESFESIEHGGDDFEINDEFDNRVDEEIEESTKLHFGLSKVFGSNEVTLTSIFANYHPVKAYSDLEDLLEDDEFIDSIPDGDSYYEVFPEEDSFDVEVVEEAPQVLTQGDYLGQILAYASGLQIQLYQSVIEAERLNDTKLLRDAYDLIYLLRSETDMLINRSEIVNSNFNIFDNIDLRNQPQISDLESLKQNYILVLEYCYPNVDHAMQKLLDDWINSLNSYHIC